MAIKLTGPEENSVLIDANITELILYHIDIKEHFHYARFYIDDVFFDELVIPRISTSKLVLQFSNLLLKTISFPIVQNASVFNYRLDRRLKIEIYKKKGSLTNLVNTFNYSLRYAAKPTNERFDNDLLSFIDVQADVLVVGERASIILPFYSLIEDNINVRLEDDHGTVLYNGFYSDNPPNRTFVIRFELITVPLASNALLLTIKAGTATITKKIRVFRNTLYAGKLVEFRNKFGFPIRVSLFGKLACKDDVTVTTYESGLGVLNTAEVKEETTFTLDTGYLTENERGIVSQIVNSLETKIKIGNEFVKCIPTVKSITTFTEGEFITQNQLSFKINKNPKIKN